MGIPQVKLLPDDIEKIVGFTGYGNPLAPVWFIGKEEGLGDMTSTDIADNLKVRTSFGLTMDLYEAHH